MSADATALVRQEWEDGARRLETERADRARYERLVRQVELVVDELRRRVGQTYSLDELAAGYRDAERWAREVVGREAPSPGWPRDLALVLAAAFHSYQRGALDYLA
jgi:hypothetical protein